MVSFLLPIFVSTSVKRAESGAARAIGVSNYEERHLAEMPGYTDVLPLVNQAELHPHFPNARLLSACKAAGVHFQVRRGQE